jgi:hypothetical protein
MITNDGKQIIAKFLLGQAPDFATHIAAGCGEFPLFPSQVLSTQAQSDMKIKKSLTFEAFRVPIIARGIIREDGVDKIVIKAETPTEQRFLLSEIGFFSAANNTIAGIYDSKSLSTFVSTETWNISSSTTSSAVLTLDGSSLYDTSYNINTLDKAFFINSNSELFSNALRKDRREPTRFYNNALALSSSSSKIDSSFNITSNALNTFWIQNSNISADMSVNLPTDQIKIALSLISKTTNNDSHPAKVRIILDFVNEIPSTGLTAPKARVTAELSSSDFQQVVGATTYNNRYKVITKTISQFTKDDTFSWANIRATRLYACAVDSSENLLDTYYIAFDGIRLDNVSTENPLYAMVGYNILRNDSAYPILKSANTNNFIEYRFGIGVS